MRLREWLEKKGISTYELNLKCGFGRSGRLYNYMIHGKIPSYTTLAAIVRATNGAVTPNDFWDLPATIASGRPVGITAPRTRPGRREGPQGKRGK